MDNDSPRTDVATDVSAAGTAAETATVPAAQVRGLGIIVFRTSDASRLIWFYKEKLGFVEGEQMLSPGLSLEAGDAKIYITDEGLDQAPSSSPENGMRIALIVSGLRDALGRLRADGVTVLSDLDASSEYFGTCVIADPDGNAIELWGKP